MWVADGATGKVIRLDRRGRRVTKQVDVGSSPAALAVLGGTVWAATLAPAAAHRGGTLRVTSPPIPPGVSGDFIDPDYLNPLVSVAYDGLVAYRRAGGAAGGTLVPDLAKGAAGARPGRPDLSLPAALRGALLGRRPRAA